MFAKGKSGNTKGRPKGIPNKTTMAAKEAFRFAFDTMGGAENLAKWGKKNQTEFYKLYGRMIPVDMNHSGNINVSVPEVSRLIAEVFGGGSIPDASVSDQMGIGQEQIQSGTQGKADPMDNDRRV